MRALAVNLKHLYQRRIMWVIGPLFIYYFFMTLMMLMTEGPAYPLMYLILSIGLGVLVGSMQKDTMTKPMLFLLPLHQTTGRAFVFIIGFLWHFVTPIVLILVGNPGYSQAIAFAAFGMAFYLLSAATMFYFAKQTLPIFIGILPQMGLVFGLTALHIRFSFFVANELWVGLLFCGTACAFVWRLYGRRTLARKACRGDAWTIFHGADTREGQAVIQRQLNRRWGKEKHRVGWAERFFPTRMERCPPGGISRYVWGALYELCAVFSVKHHFFMVFGWTLCAICFGYVPLPLGILTSVMFVILPAQSCFAVNLRLQKNLPRCAGRRERFMGLFSTVAFAVAVVMTMLTLLLAFSLALAPVMPDFHEILTFHSMEMRYLYLPLLIMPLGFVVHLIFSRSKAVEVGLIVILLSPGQVYAKPLTALGPTFLTGLVVLVWGLFIYFLWHRCMKRPLTGRG